MQHSSRKQSILAAQPGVKQARQQIGILAPPACEPRVEAIDPVEIAAPDRKIARTRAAQDVSTDLTQGPKGQPQHRSQSVEIARQALTDAL
jgi:hypothetical protein